eukprot:710451_1
MVKLAKLTCCCCITIKLACFLSSLFLLVCATGALIGRLGALGSAKNAFPNVAQIATMLPAISKDGLDAFLENQAILFEYSAIGFITISGIWMMVECFVKHNNIVR